MCSASGATGVVRVGDRENPFVRGTDDARGRVLDTDGRLRRDELTDGSVFHAPTVFRLKAIPFHAGLLTDRGKEPHRLDPTNDVWALRRPLDRFR